jgi:Fe-S-cluster containining protein
VSFIANYPRSGVGGFYFWKTARNPQQVCPFYDKLCTIYSTRPLSCKDYPLGSTRPKGCPAYVKPPRQVKRRIIRRQTKDFQRANECLRPLLSIITNARAVSDGE